MSGLEAVLAAHEPVEDWHCACGEDMFGGTAAYSIAAHRAHVAGQIYAHLAGVARDEGVREAVANTIPLGWTARDPYRDVYEAADAAVAAFLAAIA